VKQNAVTTYFHETFDLSALFVWFWSRNINDCIL